MQDDVAQLHHGDRFVVQSAQMAQIRERLDAAAWRLTSLQVRVDALSARLGRVTGALQGVELRTADIEHRLKEA